MWIHQAIEILMTLKKNFPCNLSFYVIIFLFRLLEITMERQKDMLWRRLKNQVMDL